MAVSQEIDEARRRIVLTFGPEDGGRAGADLVCRLLESRPELAGYDFLYDFTRWSGESTNADVERIAACYKPRQVDDGRTKHTVFVTRDENFIFWALAMNQFFADRRHHVAPTLAAAHARLDALGGPES